MSDTPETEQSQHQMPMRVTYHRKEMCNNCGSLNDVKWVDGEGGIMYEGETKCTCCGFLDYWAHGFFMSMQDGYDKCEKYQTNADE